MDEDDEDFKEWRSNNLLKLKNQARQLVSLRC